MCSNNSISTNRNSSINFTIFLSSLYFLFFGGPISHCSANCLSCVIPLYGSLLFKGNLVEWTLKGSLFQTYRF